MAIASKIADSEVVVVDQCALETPKTKQVAGLLRALQLEGSTTLIATAGSDQMVYMSARNIEGVSVSAVRDLNALSVLKPGGHFLAKTFQGGSEGDLLTTLKHNFRSVHHVKPPASRDESVELYLLAKDFRGTDIKPD